MRRNLNQDEVERLISLNTLDILTEDPLVGEADMAADILLLQPMLVPRLRAEVHYREWYDGAWATHERVRTYTVENGTLEFGQLFGWLDLGTRFVSHSVVVDVNTQDEWLMDISRGDEDFIVLRPDPALTLIEPWAFGRGGWEDDAPSIIRLDPEAVATDANQVRNALCRNQLVDAGPLVLGDPCGAEPERVMAHAATRLAQGGDYGLRGHPHASLRA